VLLASVARDRPALELRLESFLRAELERWTGAAPLTFVNSYGPRTYGRGSTLAAHGDRMRTHALSAIVFVDSRNAPGGWPLQFVPVGAAPQSRVLELSLSAGRDVLLYESTQPHGRETPLRGDSFTAVFLHWKPAGWSERVAALLG
jgi:hypothetical protein